LDFSAFVTILKACFGCSGPFFLENSFFTR
jgi:hypothetical protein